MRKLLFKLALSGIHYSGLGKLTSLWTGGMGGILMLHRVDVPSQSAFAPNKGLTINPAYLEIMIRGLKNSGYEFVSMDVLVDQLIEKQTYPTKRKQLAVTLDDGYRDNALNAVPLFRKYDIPYTIYVAPGLVDGRATLWWEDLSALIAANDHIRFAHKSGRQEFETRTPQEKTKLYQELFEFLANHVSEQEQRTIMAELAWMYKLDPEQHRKNSIMNWQEIAQLSTDPLCTIGAHTIHHYAVGRLPEDEALSEMKSSADIVEMETGTRPVHFAFPYGHKISAGARDFDLARQAGFKSAVTTRHGVIHPEHRYHRQALPRISINGEFQSNAYSKALLSGIPTLLANKGGRLNVG